jgi:hypothetical protein
MSFKYLLAIFFAYLPVAVMAQGGDKLKPMCGFDHAHQEALANDPEFARNVKVNEQKVKEMLDGGIYRKVGTQAA